MVGASQTGTNALASPAGDGAARTRAGAQALVMLLLVVRCLFGMLVPALRQPGWPDVLVAVAAAGALAVILLSARPTLARAAAVGAALAFWLSVLAPAVVTGQDIPVTAVSMALVVAVLILGPADSPWPLRIGLIAGSLVAALSIVAGLLSLAGWWSGAIYGTEVYQRETFGLPALAGIAGHPNTLAQIVGLTLILAVAVALSNRRPGAAILPAVALIPLLWTQSRTSVAAALIAAVSLVLLVRFERMRPWVVGLALLAAVTPPLVWLRLGDQLPIDAVFTGRPFAWVTGIFAFAAQPLLGNGPGVFSREFWRSLDYSPADRWLPLHAHNQPLETLAQAGLVGAAALLALTLVGVVVALGRTGSNGRMCAAIVLFLGLQAGVEVPLGLTYFPVGYLMPAMAVAAMSYRGSLAWQAGYGSRTGTPGPGGYASER